MTDINKPETITDFNEEWIKKYEVKKRNNKKSLTLIGLCLLLLLLSFTQTAFYTSGKEAIISSGLSAFLLGWLNLFGPGISWLANPLLFFSWIFLISGKKKISLFFSILPLSFAYSFILFNNIIIDVPGNHGEIRGYGTGYWLWFSSCALNFIGNLILYFNLKIIPNSQ